MFGKKKTTTPKIDLRAAALSYLEELLAECEGSSDLGALLGAGELAERLELISHEEYLKYHTEGHRRHEAYQKAYKERKAKEYAERKAAKAK